MGINDLLPHLPGGGKNEYKHSFYGVIERRAVVPLDAASALWQFAAHHGWDYLRGNFIPALILWARFLVYMRDICGWTLHVFMDGRENADKLPEIERRRETARIATERHELFGQIKNTPEYIALAVHVCNFLEIRVTISAYEADPQVSYMAMQFSLTPVTGDSDLLAYGIPDDPGKLIIVKAFRHDWFRVIDLNAPVEPGEYPLLDLYRMHGRIVFQLYAGCSGCDFTKHRAGIKGIGYSIFVDLASKVEEGKLSAETLGKEIWDDDHAKVLAEKVGLKTEAAICEHLQHVVDVYSLGKVYDTENSSIINMKGEVEHEATDELKRHMKGELDSKSLRELSDELQKMKEDLKCAELIHRTAADASTIRGVQLPEGKTPEDCTVPTLRDFVAARGGKIAMNKPDLVAVVKTYQFLEKEVPRAYVDRNPDRSGSLFQKIDTSGTRNVGDILGDLACRAASFADTEDTRQLIIETQQLYQAGLFDDQYDNIARVAPELQESSIYKWFGHIGSSITEKNIGDALARCWYEKEMTYHALAFVPDTNRAIILTKPHASMSKDEKTRNQTDEGEAPKKQEYLLIMELVYKKTNAEEGDRHSLGVFVELKRSYCALCIAGQGACRHRPERLWYQFFHWSPERLGVDVPPTIKSCSWHPGGKALNSDVGQKVHQQQAVKHERSIKEQARKEKRGQKRNCTEGISGDYQPHLSSAKLESQKHPNRFDSQRMAPIFKLIREQSKK